MAFTTRIASQGNGVPDWAIIYSDYEGVEARALEFLSGEFAGVVLRKAGEYVVPSMPCVKATADFPQCNGIVLGRWERNPLLQALLKREEIPQDGYLVRVVDNPGAAGTQLILIAGDTPSAVLYGAIDFVDDGIPRLAPRYGNGLFYQHLLGSERVPSYESRRAPETKWRSVFTWGHTFIDFRKYIRQLARMRFNQVIVWNEFPPLNAQEFLDYAHSWGIQVIWGFSWGWTNGQCKSADVTKLEDYRKDILQQWHDVWSKLNGDGIYFQSFTECNEQSRGGRTIADAVVELVNKTATEILAETPSLRIIFGLHASSVKSHLDTIAKTDPRLEILWEDLGGFPYDWNRPFDETQEMELTKALFAQKRSMGLVFKNMLMMEWTRFCHQVAPYVMACASPLTVAEDEAIHAPMWTQYNADWIARADIAYRFAKAIHQDGTTQELNIAANLTDDTRFATAFAAELFWSTQEPCQAILERVLRRRWIR